MISNLLSCCVSRSTPQVSSQPLLPELNRSINNPSAKALKLKNEDWMSHHQLRRVCDLWVIPGSHHSGVIRPKKRVSHAVWGWAQTQESSLAQQLCFGIRFLDFRVRVLKGQVILSHGLSSDARLDLSLETLRYFLDTHPTEFVIVYLRADKWHEMSSEDRQKVREVILASKLVFSAALDSFATVRVGDLAGKVAYFSPDVPVPRITWRTELLAYCDIWQEPSVEEARARVTAYLQSLQARQSSGDGSLTGVALDGAFPVKQQCYTSRELNTWLLSRLQMGEFSKLRSLGLLIIDFASDDFVAALLAFNRPMKTVRISENITTVIAG
jgi:hypothetical protein